MKNFKQNIRLILLLFLFCIAGLSAVAQNKPIIRDSSAIQARYFDQAKLQGYQKDPDFKYITAKEPPKSLWNRFWDWFWSKIGGLLSTRSGRATFKYTLLLIAIVVLVLFIFQLRKMNAVGLFRVSKGSNIPFSVLDDDIHAINFEQEIADAVSQGNFRLAVRLLYLQSLKKLSDLGFITWRIDKTNISYVNEVRGSNFYQEFYRLTAQFENNWYGNIPINQGEYENVSQAFDSLNRRIGI